MTMLELLAARLDFSKLIPIKVLILIQQHRHCITHWGPELHRQLRALTPTPLIRASRLACRPDTTMGLISRYLMSPTLSLLIPAVFVLHHWLPSKPKVLETHSG